MPSAGGFRTARTAVIRPRRGAEPPIQRWPISPLSIGLTSMIGVPSNSRMAHSHVSAVDGSELHPVQADGIRTTRRSGTEDTLLRLWWVAPWVHAQNVATRAIEPRDDDNVIAGLEAPETFKHLRFENQPGLRCTFVGLQRGRLEISQGRLRPFRWPSPRNWSPFSPDQPRFGLAGAKPQPSVWSTCAPPPPWSFGDIQCSASMRSRKRL